VTAAAPTAGGEAAAALAREPFVYGSVAGTANYWPMFIAQARGYYTEQGIEVEDSTMGGASAAALALVSGSIELTAANPDPLVRAAASGADLVMVGATVNPTIYGLFGNKNVAGLPALRGQTLSVGGPKDVTAYLLTRMLEPNGLHGGDYDLIYAGSTPDRYQQLQTAAVAATLLTQPFDLVARREGFPVLLYSNQYVTNLPTTTMTVTRAWVENEQNRARLVRWLAAIYKASQALCDPAQKDAMVRILADTARLPDEDARQTYAFLVEETRSFKCDLRLTPDELQSIVDYIAALGDLAPPLPDPRRIVDTSVLDQAIARGR
jgi:NitT/TauT family transport system substrate-binding protein